MRAFRPSQFGRADEVNEEVERAKEWNLRQYEERAQAGLPLFDKPAALAKESNPVRLTFEH